MVRICARLLQEGVCNDENCSLSHTAYTCEPCKKVIARKCDYESHLRGAGHQKRILQVPGWVSCTICNKTLPGGSWNSHATSHAHARAAAAQGFDPNIDPVTVYDVTGQSYCPTCNVHVLSSAWARHTTSNRHFQASALSSFAAALENAEQDKHGVVVGGKFDFGVVEQESATTGVRVRNEIITTVPALRVQLANIQLSSSKNARPLKTPFSIITSGDTLTSRTPITITITATQSWAGREEDRLELTFRDSQLGTTFLIIKTLRIVAVTNAAQHRALQPVSPYKPKERTKRHPEREVEPGEKPPALGTIPYVVKLGQALVPTGIKSVLDRGNPRDQATAIRASFLPINLNVGSYAQHFRTLAWVEEHRMSVDLEYYDIEDATLSSFNGYHYVSVPGLAEKRPSVLVGDSILVRRPNDPEGSWFEGCVHVVRKEEVGMRFSGRFRPTGPHYTVRFKLNRYPLRRQHQALNTAFAPQRLLFPEASPARSLTGCPIRFFNTFIARNERQKLAVTCIANLPAGSPPFIVFGPPGTGKTVTIVEAIRQVVDRNPNARVLACAPSNSAADLIAERLVNLGEGNLFRFYAPSRPSAAASDKLDKFTYKGPNGHFSIPSVRSAMDFRVCVTTCVSASVFFGIGVPRGHFTHVFVDEAGQATEPEAMIAVKTMADNKTNVVLSGDPKQLGPIIRSPVARELGLETSYIERLMRTDAYDSVNGHGQRVVKLTQNFRSHPAILRFPNEKFYNNDLVPCGPPADIDAFIGSAILPPAGKKFPVMFVSMSGKDTREASSPSFFNVEECLMVKKLVEELRGDRRLRIVDADIGVVAPYHAQVLKIRNALRNSAEGVKVGSVEEFQGQERKIIIISTVRSSREYVQYDLRHTLGFVANPRRFNVAVTRAKALLIIIGDPMVLGLDPLWREFLNYIHGGGGWTGKDCPWDPTIPVNPMGGYDTAVREAADQDMNELARLMEGATLENVDEGDDANIDLPWNREA
ncbi:RNA helicase [Cylindrobasidium torrendii FP15055 ss-10]|uniref:RNA helicase n=1 Tax=Cylindrobasidium torrendii FP15055 ss-10 TaxID=1314674 RepID=A0A0D7BAS6_9AGAR|nr:RNA helicase [Cylindrobasidium torrendii FP15055 ss-10]